MLLVITNEWKISFMGVWCIRFQVSFQAKFLNQPIIHFSFHPFSCFFALIISFLFLRFSVSYCKSFNAVKESGKETNIPRGYNMQSQGKKSHTQKRKSKRTRSYRFHSDNQLSCNPVCKWYEISKNISLVCDFFSVPVIFSYFTSHFFFFSLFKWYEKKRINENRLIFHVNYSAIGHPTLFELKNKWCLYQPFGYFNEN